MLSTISRYVFNRKAKAVIKIPVMGSQRKSILGIKGANMKMKLEFSFNEDEMDKFKNCANWENAQLALWNIQNIGYKAREEKWCNCRWIREINDIFKSYEIEVTGEYIQKNWECDCG